MAMIYCSQCGKQISDLAPVCPQCGAPQQVAPQYQNPVQPIYMSKYKNPGGGFSTASMILGIMAALFALLYSIGAIGDIVDGNLYFTLTEITIKEQLESRMKLMLFTMFIAFFSLIFAAIAHIKGCKSKEIPAAIVMGISSIIIPLVLFMIGMSLSD